MSLISCRRHISDFSNRLHPPYSTTLPFAQNYPAKKQSHDASDLLPRGKTYKNMKQERLRDKKMRKGMVKYELEVINERETVRIVSDTTEPMEVRQVEEAELQTGEEGEGLIDIVVSQCPQLTTNVQTIQGQNKLKIKKRRYVGMKEVEKLHEGSQPETLTELIQNRSVSFLKEIKSGDMYYISSIFSYNTSSKALSFKATPYLELHFIEAYRTYTVLKTISMPLEAKQLRLNRSFTGKSKKVLVLDLDETLIHSESPEGGKCMLFPNYTFDISGNRRGFLPRKHLRWFLQSMSRHFYVMIFTASTQSYADQILDCIDPSHNLIHQRLYRQHCYQWGQAYIKDLRILGRDLSQVILVDNSISGYMFQIDNGVPILPFLGHDDHELRSLGHYLLRIRRVDDVRPVNRRIFKQYLYSKTNSWDHHLHLYCSSLTKSINR